MRVKKFMELAGKDGFFVYDTETTGLSPALHDVIEFSAIRCHLESGTGVEDGRIDIYVKPGYELPDKIVEITGITDKELEEKGLPPKDAVLKIRSFLGENPVMAGYNSPSFDEGFVKKLYGSQGYGFTPAADLDVLKIAKEKLPGRHRLCDSAAAAGVTGITFHRSIDDARATLGVLNYLLPMYVHEGPEIGIKSIARWHKSDTLDRIYVSNEENRPAYYDVPGRRWVIDGRLDEEGLKDAAYAFAGVSSDEGLVEKYTR